MRKSKIIKAIVSLCVLCMLVGAVATVVYANSVAPWRSPEQEKFVFRDDTGISLIAEVVTVELATDGHALDRVTVNYLMENTLAEDVRLPMLFVTPKREEQLDTVIRVNGQQITDIQFHQDIAKPDNWNTLAGATIVNPFDGQVVTGDDEGLGGLAFLNGFEYVVDFLANEQLEMEIVYYTMSGYYIPDGLKQQIYLHVYYLTPAKFWQGEANVELRLILPEDKERVFHSNIALTELVSESDETNLGDTVNNAKAMGKTYVVNFTGLPDEEWVITYTPAKKPIGPADILFRTALIVILFIIGMVVAWRRAVRKNSYLLSSFLFFVILLILLTPVSTVEAYDYELGYYYGKQEATFYYYDKQMTNWSYYNIYAWANINFSEQWKTTDGWGSMYLEDLQEWYWYYHDLQADKLYHYNPDNKVWYLYADNGTWKFYAVEEDEAWYYDIQNQVWNYDGLGIVNSTQEVASTADTALANQYSSFSEAVDDQFNQGVNENWSVADPNLTYDWETDSWIFDEQYFIDNVTDEQLDVLFDSVIEGIYDFVEQQLDIDSGKKKTTFMIYMNGTDLESRGMFGSADIEELWEHGSNNDLNIVIKTGGTKEWFTPGIDAQQSQYWYVDQFGISHLLDVGPAASNSIGEAKAIENFIKYSYNNHPAEKYVLIYWNHGGGTIFGYGHDEHTEDSLSLNEIFEGMRAAKEETGIEFELVGFDACLMATLETAQIMQPFAKYFIASEELEPGHGWNYEPIIKALHDNPNIRGDALGRVIIDSFREYSIANNTSSYITLSLIELKQLNQVVKALEEVVKDLQGADLDFGNADRFAQIVHARNRAESYGGGSHYDLVDIWDLADQLQIQGFSSINAEKLKLAIERAVVYAIGSPKNPVAKGLSIYYPAKNPDLYNYAWKVLQDMNFSREYREFVGRYLSRLMTNRGHRSLLAITDQPMIAEREQLVFARFNDLELPKVTSALVELGYVSNNQIRWLGVKEAYFDKDKQAIVAGLDNQWYIINNNYVATKIETNNRKLNYAVEVNYNGGPAHLIYEQKENGEYELLSVRYYAEDKITRLMNVMPAMGDVIQLRYGKLLGEEIVYGDNSDLVMQTKDISSEDVIGYRFVTTDLLGMTTYSDIAYIGKISEEIINKLNESSGSEVGDDSEHDINAMSFSQKIIIVAGVVILLLLTIIVILLLKTKKKASE